MSGNEAMWVRQTGIAAMVGGAILVLRVGLGDVLLRYLVGGPGSLSLLLTQLVWALGAFLLAAGAGGLALRTWNRLGPLGHLGVVVAALGFVSWGLASLFVGLGTYSPTEANPLETLGILGSAGGATLLGLGFLRSRTGTPWTSALLTLSFPLLVAMLFLQSPELRTVGGALADLVFAAPFGAAWILLGRAMYTEDLEPASTHRPRAQGAG